MVVFIRLHYQVSPAKTRVARNKRAAIDIGSAATEIGNSYINSLILS